MSKLALRSLGVALLAGALLFVVCANQARAGCNPPGQTRTELTDFTVKNTATGGGSATATAASSPNPGTLYICEDATGKAKIEMSAIASMGAPKYIGWRIEKATGGASDLIADGSTGHADPNQGKVDSTTASDKQSTLTVTRGNEDVREFYVKAFCDGGALNPKDGKKDADEDYYYDINGAVIEVKVVVIKVELEQTDDNSPLSPKNRICSNAQTDYKNVSYKIHLNPSAGFTANATITGTGGLTFDDGTTTKTALADGAVVTLKVAGEATGSWKLTTQCEQLTACEDEKDEEAFRFVKQGPTYEGRRIISSAQVPSGSILTDNSTDHNYDFSTKSDDGTEALMMTRVVGKFGVSTVPAGRYGGVVNADLDARLTATLWEDNNCVSEWRFWVCGGIFHCADSGSMLRPPKWKRMSVLSRSRLR